MTKHCEHCSKGLANPSSLKRHIIAKHADKIATLVRHEHRCSSCDDKFARNETLQRHIGSKHTRELMVRCQFCLENFRKDYFARHESRCGRRYWDKVCKNANFTNRIRDDQSNDINVGPAVRRGICPDAHPIHATGDTLRVVHEIDLDPGLTSKAFEFVFLHCSETEDVDFCLEAITAGFRMNIPIDPQPFEYPGYHPFRDLRTLANSIGRCVRGERDINARYDDGYTPLDYACLVGAASLIELLVRKGADFGELSLYLAIENGSFDTVQSCLALGADPNASFKLLLVALRQPYDTRIAALLVEYGADVLVRNSKGETPLHLAAKQADAGFIRVLLAKNSTFEFVNAIDESGYCALHEVIINKADDYSDAAECTSMLLDAGADPIALSGTDAAMSSSIKRCLLPCMQRASSLINNNRARRVRVVSRLSRG